jgi:hypothetical protein
VNEKDIDAVIEAAEAQWAKAGDRVEKLLKAITAG